MAITISGVTLGNISGGPSSLTIEDLADVSIVSPVTGDYLRYNGTISEWQNASIDSDVYGFLSTNILGTNGVTITPIAGPDTVTIGLGAITPTSVAASGTVTGSNLSGTNTGDQTITLTGDVTGSGTGSFATTLANSGVSAGVYAPSSITVDAKGRITSITGGGGGAGSVTSVDISGSDGIGVSGSPITTSGTITLTLGNITPDSVAATGTVTGSNLSGTNTGDQTITLTGDVTGSGTGSFAATLATVNSSPQTDTFRKITVNGKGLVTATSAVLDSDITTVLGYTPVNKAGDTMSGNLVLNADPTTALGAATKQYVDNVASGLNVHPACDTSTTASLASSTGGTITYDNGTAGVGATLTTTTSWGTIGGHAVAVTERVLVKNESNQIHNGVYVVTSSTVLTRASDFDDSPDGEVVAGDFVYIQHGTLAGTQWVQTAIDPVIGTDNVVFTQLSGTGTITGGTGITVTGNSVALATGNTLSLFNLATNGLIARTAANTVEARSLAVSGVGLSISDADGVAGNPTITSNATSSNTASTIVSRDGSGNFSAGTITATTFSGNATSATSATNATNATNVGITDDTTTNATEFITWSPTSSGNNGLRVTSTKLTFNPSTGNLSSTLFTGSGAGLTNIPNAALTNSSITIGSTSISLGGSSTTLSGLTTVTATTFSGNATTATTATNATNAAITDDNATNANEFVVWSPNSTGNNGLRVSSTKFLFNPSTGLVTATAFNATSTSRVKQAITDINSSYIEKFMDLKPREYDRTDYKAHEFGFVAEEMAEIYPEIVGKDNEGKPSGIDYGKLSTILTAKVQEQQKIIDKLQDQVSKIMELLKGTI